MGLSPRLATVLCSSPFVLVKKCEVRSGVAGLGALMLIIERKQLYLLEIYIVLTLAFVTRASALEQVVPVPGRLRLHST